MDISSTDVSKDAFTISFLKTRKKELEFYI